MRAPLVLAAVAACNGSPDVSLDVAPDAAPVAPDAMPQPDALGFDPPVFTCRGTPLQGMLSMPATACAGDGGFPAACARPAGVTWIETDGEHSVTAPLPAGLYREDPIAGCMWIVVWPAPHHGFTVETAALGCAMALHVPAEFAQDGCGHAHLTGSGCAQIGFGVEVCSSSGRGYWASGGTGLAIDGVAGTLTTNGFGFDTSSSPADCRCQ